MSEKSRIALVTGSGQRVGKMIALILARNGWDLLVHYSTSLDQARETVKEINQCGVSASLIQADLRQPEQIRSMFEKAVELGGLNLLVNSAAVMIKSPLRTVSVAAWDEVMDLNLRAPLLCSQFAYQYMDSTGSIINISDALAHQIWRSNAAYGLSKSALEQLTVLLAESFKPKIRVNAIAPGLLLQPAEMTNDDWIMLSKKIKKEPVSHSALNEAILLLTEDQNITGEVIQLTGGDSLIRSNQR